MLRENDLQHPFSTPSRVEGKRLSERREMKGERIKALVDIMAESLENFDEKHYPDSKFTSRKMTGNRSTLRHILVKLWKNKGKILKVAGEKLFSIYAAAAAAQSLQSCEPTDSSPPGPSVHGML